MTPRSSAPDDREPLSALFEDLSKSLGKKGAVRLPERTVERINQFARDKREREDVVSDDLIGELVSILEGDSNNSAESTPEGSSGSQNLKDLPLGIKSFVRLDISSWAVVLQTLLLAKRCRSVERGVYLLAASLYHETIVSKTPTSVKALKKRKLDIGTQVFQQLLECFITRGDEDHMRVWAGSILALLLEGCIKNADHLMLAPEDTKRKFGRLVLNETDEVARIVAGKLLKASFEAEIGMNIFWPTHEDQAAYLNFPLSQSNMAWNHAFQHWVDDGTNRGRAILHFAQRVHTTPPILDVLDKDVGITLFILNDGGGYEFSIYAQARDICFDQRLDVPLNLISALDVIETPRNSTLNLSTKPFDLVMALREPSDEKACFINASRCAVHQLREIRITVLDQRRAQILRDDIKNYLIRVEKVSVQTEAHTELTEADIQAEVRLASHPSQESIRRVWTGMSQSAVPLYLHDDEVDESTEDSHSEPHSDHARNESFGNQVVEKSQIDKEKAIRESRQATIVLDSPVEKMRGNLEIKTHSYRNSPKPASSDPLMLNNVISIKDKAVPNNEITNPDASQGTSLQQLKQPFSPSKDNKTAEIYLDAQKAVPKGRREIPTKQPIGQNVGAVVPDLSQEAGSKLKQGKRKNKPAREADVSRDIEVRKKANANAKPTLNQGSHGEPQNTANVRSLNRREDTIREQPRTLVADKGKGKRKSIDNSGISTDKSKPRTIQSPDLSRVHGSWSSITTPDSHDASTPKVARNAALRQKDALHANRKEPVMVNTNNPPKEVGSKSAGSEPPKKYSLKAKPAIPTSQRTAKPIGKKKQASAANDVIESNTDAGLSTQIYDKAAPTEAQAKTGQKSSNRKPAKIEKKAITKEKDIKSSIWDLPSDAEAIPIKHREEDKAAIKTSEQSSKNPGTGKVTKNKKADVKSARKPAAIKNIATNKKQSAPGKADVPYRSRRKAAVAAASKISQLSSDNDFANDDVEDIELAGRAVADEHSVRVARLEVSVTSKKPTQPTNTAVKEAATLSMKSGNGMENLTVNNKNVIKKAPKLPLESIAEPPDTLFQQPEKDTLQRNPTQESFNAVEQNPVVASSVPQTREPRDNPRKRPSRYISTALKGMIEEIELDSDEEINEDHARSTGQVKETDTILNISRLSDVIIAETNLSLHKKRPAGPLKFPSPTLQSPQAHKDDQQARDTPQSEYIDPIFAPSTEKKWQIFGTGSGPFKRRRLHSQPMDPSSEPDVLDSSRKKSRKLKSKTAKKSTPPLRRSPRLHDQGPKASADLDQVVSQEVVLLNDRLARKTPLIAFGKIGAKNQGVSSSKKVSTHQPSLHLSVDAVTSWDEMQNVGKRKRGSEPVPIDQDRGPRTRVRTSREQAEIQMTKGEKAMAKNAMHPISRGIVENIGLNESDHEMDNEVGNNYYDNLRTPRTPPGQEAAVPHTIEGPDFKIYHPPQQKIGGYSYPLAAQEPSQPRKNASQTSKVDENGSPIGSVESTVEWKTLMRGLVDNVGKNKERLLESNTGQGDLEEDGAGFYFPKKLAGAPSHLEMLSSNAKAKPVAPNTEQQKYVPHRETGDNIYQDLASKEVVRSKRQMKDPFTERQLRRQVSDFAKRLEASRGNLVEQRTPALTIKLTHRYKSGHAKYQLIKDAGPVQEVDSGMQARTNQTLPEMKESAMYPKTVEAPVEDSWKQPSGVGWKRRGLIELDQYQTVVGSQRKRRKPSLEVQESKVDTRKKEWQRKPQHRAPKPPQLVDESVQALATEEGYQRIMQERPARDPEETLVEEQSSTSSELTSRSSASIGSSPVSQEWRVELQRHERPILETLYSIANELTRHLVGQRETIKEVVNDYTAGGTNLIEMLKSGHHTEKDRVLTGFEAAKAGLSRTYIAAQCNIARNSKEAKSPLISISGLEKEWRGQDAELQSFIAENLEEE